MNVEIGRTYRHFKGNLFLVEAIAQDCERECLMVIYRALYGNNKLFTRTIEDFTSQVNFNEYPTARQNNKFELIKIESAVDYSKNTV